MADFFREVDEDVRRDQLIRFWKKYQNWIIGAAVVIIAATAGWRLYEHFRLKAGEAAGTRYEAALQLLTAGKSAEAAAAFEVFAERRTARLRDAGAACRRRRARGKGFRRCG